MVTFRAIATYALFTLTQCQCLRFRWHVAGISKWHFTASRDPCTS